MTTESRGSDEFDGSGAGAAPSTAPREGRWARAGLPVLVGIVLVLGAVYLWRLQVAKDRREAGYGRAQQARALAHDAAALLEAEARRGRDLAGQFQRGAIHDAADFEAAVKSVSSPALLTAAWVSREGVCEYAWSSTADPVLRVGGRLTDLPLWSHALWRARTERLARVVDVVRHEGDVQILALTPAVSGEGTAAAHLGCVALRVDLTRALAGWGRAEADYSVDMTDGPLRVMERGRPIDEGDALLDVEAVPVVNRFFRLRVRPTEAAAARLTWRSSGWMLGALLAGAASLAWVVWYAMRRRWEAAEEAGRQVAALRSLMQTAAVIASSSGAGREALRRLAGSARRLLKMDSAAVCVVNERADRVEVLAYDGGELRDGGAGFPLAEAKGTRQCIEGGQLIVVEDALHDPRVNRESLEAHGVRSAMFVPLTVENRALGLLFLGHRSAKRFDEADKQLGRVLGAQAGVILANVRLHEEKDAALAAQRQLATRHEALFQIAAEIYGSDDLDASLRRLAEAAPGVLGVDLCVVTLRTGEEDARIAAVTGNFANCQGERVVVTNTNLARVWETRRVLVIEDGVNDPTLHPAYRHRMHVGSIMYVPLIDRRDDRPIGSMALIRHEPGAFTPEQSELAGVLAARAAAAIQTARLHEEARRSAQTQEMLLRELNHRVKNNLASIVALLSLNTPDMPREAQGWLNRVTERIATMARTHDLFVGGNDRVDLRTLVAKLLPGLSVIKPAGAEIRTELERVEVELGTERAVSLAMVLNELCWNALEHGTPENGVLRVRGSGMDGGRLAMEIEDQGRGAGTREANGVVRNGRGIGMKVVEGLVSRELRGRLIIGATESGGTLARIEIPLEEGESPGLSL